MSAPGVTLALSPYQRGQAALDNALAQAGYPSGSDERMQFLCGLCAEVFGMVDPGAGPGVAQGVAQLQGIVEAGLRQRPVADLLADLVQARRQADALGEVLQQLTAALASVLGAHLRGDAKALSREMGKFMGAHCKVMPPTSGALQ